MILKSQTSSNGFFLWSLVLLYNVLNDNKHDNFKNKVLFIKMKKASQNAKKLLCKTPVSEIYFCFNQLIKTAVLFFKKLYQNESNKSQSTQNNFNKQLYFVHI